MIHNFKDDLILSYSRNNRVLHIGATDAPIHIQKMRGKTLLHQKLQEICKTLIGIDIDEKAIRELKKFNINNIIKHDLMNPFNKKYKGKFDIIVFGDVIEHLANPGIALQHLLEIMDENTKLLVATPNCYCYSSLTNIFRKVEEVHEDHCFWPSKRTMLQLFKRYNFCVDKFDYVNIGSYPDIRTIKGRVFYYLVLKHFKKIRSTLFFVLRKRASSKNLDNQR